MRILCAHPAFRVLEMSLSQLGEKQIAPDEALDDRSLPSISQWWTDKNYFARVQGNAAETGHHTQLPGNSPGRGIVSEAMPSNGREFQGFTCRLQYTAKQVFGVKWSLLASGEDEILRTRLPCSSTLNLKCFSHRIAHWNVPPAVPRLWTSKLSFGYGFPDLDCSA